MGRAASLCLLIYASCTGPGYGPDAAGGDPGPVKPLFEGQDLIIHGEAAGEVTFWATAEWASGSGEGLELRGLVLRRGPPHAPTLEVAAPTARLRLGDNRLTLMGGVAGRAQLSPDLAATAASPSPPRPDVGCLGRPPPAPPQP